MFLEITNGLLTYTGDSPTNLTVSVGIGPNAGYALNDTADLITLGPGAVAAGWRGSGTHTVGGLASVISSIEISPQAGGVVNLRSLSSPTTVNGGPVATQVNISSTAPINSGNLQAITADVTINAGTNTSLWVADVTATSGHSNVRITDSAITGLGPCDFLLNGGLANLRVSGSVSHTLAEIFSVSPSPGVKFRLDC